MGKSRENAATGRKKNRGKPRKYGPGKAELCRHVGISMTVDLAERLRVAAKQMGVSRSAVVVAAVRAALAQSPDRLAAEVASSGRAGE